MESKGFTLIELICIIALLGIIALISFPRINGMNDNYLDSISKELLYDIRFVRNQNMSEPSKSYNLVMTNNSYYIKMSNPLPKIVKTKSLKDNYSLAYNQEQTLIFNVYGAPNKGQTITVMNTLNNHYREITIIPNTGRIQLKE